MTNIWGVPLNALKLMLQVLMLGCLSLVYNPHAFYEINPGVWSTGMHFQFSHIQLLKYLQEICVKTHLQVTAADCKYVHVCALFVECNEIILDFFIFLCNLRNSTVQIYQTHFKTHSFTSTSTELLFKILNIIF